MVRAIRVRDVLLLENKRFGGRDNFAVSFDLVADLSEDFHWNMYKIFLALVAETKDPLTGVISQSIVWDRVLGSAREAKAAVDAAAAAAAVATATAEAPGAPGASGASGAPTVPGIESLIATMPTLPTDDEVIEDQEMMQHQYLVGANGGFAWPSMALRSLPAEYLVEGHGDLRGREVRLRLFADLVPITGRPQWVEYVTEPVRAEPGGKGNATVFTLPNSYSRPV